MSSALAMTHTTVRSTNITAERMTALLSVADAATTGHRPANCTSTGLNMTAPLINIFLKVKSFSFICLPPP